MDTYDVIVVGGGISGLTAADYLQQHGMSVLILDKAKRLGGRVASGKIGDVLLDVGVPCSNEGSDSTASTAGDQLVFRSLPFEQNHGGSAAERCSSWSKEFPWQQGFVTHLEQRTTDVAVVTEYSGASFVGRNVILTCPPEQSAQVLQLSGLTRPPEFDQIAHTKEVLLLVEVATSHLGELATSEFLSVHQQVSSSESGHAALALKASVAWSEHHFDHDAQNTRALLLAEFAQMSNGTHVLRSETKRWRYANARSTTEAPLVSVDGARGVYCAGDGFGELSLSGVERAMRSGLAVATQLLS